MSKAFLPEDAVPESGPLLPSRGTARQPITAAGYRRLHDERLALDPADPQSHARALLLDRILATVDVVPTALVDGGAGFGCTVTVEDEHGARRPYTLVGPDEVDAAAGRISTASPIGQALLGRRAGDTVEVGRGGKRVELTVVDISVT